MSLVSRLYSDDTFDPLEGGSRTVVKASSRVRYHYYI